MHAGRCIDRDIANLCKLAVDRQISMSLEMQRDFVGDRYLKCVKDIESPFAALSHALTVGEPALFADYVIWAGITLANLGLSDASLTESLMAMSETLTAELPDRAASVSVGYIGLSFKALEGAAVGAPDVAPAVAPLTDTAAAYLSALLSGDRWGAEALVRDAAAAGAALTDIYEHVFRVTQHQVGRMWQFERLSVAMEHYATGATEAVMAQLRVEQLHGPSGARRFLGACAEGEEHDMAIRMICDVLRSRGWETFFLGASTPESALVEAVEAFRPSVVGLSATWLLNVENVRRAIVRIRETHPEVRLVVGGAPFDQIVGLADKVGADARGESLFKLSDQLDRLIAPTY